MASRRPYGAGASAASGAVEGFGQALQAIFAGQDKEEAANRITARQQEMKDHAEAVKLLDRIQEGKADPQDFTPDAAPLKLARKLGIDLNKVGPSQDERMAGVTSAIGPDTTDSQIQGLFAKNKVNAGLNFDTTPPEPPSAISAGSPPPITPQSLTPVGPQAVPEPVKRAMQARIEAQQALKTKMGRDVTQEGAMAGAKAGGAFDAIEGNEARATQQAKQAQNMAYAHEAGTEDAKLVPERVDASAAAAGKQAEATAAGTGRAQHTPAYAAGESRLTHARERARNEEEWTNPAVLKGKMDVYAAQGIAQARAAGETQEIKETLESIGTIQGIGKDIGRIKELSDQLNKSHPDLPGFVQRGGEKLAAFMQTNPDAAELERLRTNMGRLLGNNKFFGGNRGAQSENDARAIADRLPGVGTERSLAVKMMNSFEQKLTDALDMANKMPPGTPYEVRVKAARDAFGLAMASADSSGAPGSSSIDAAAQKFLENWRRGQ